MGNCSTCDDPNIYESHYELKPAKKTHENQENILTKGKEITTSPKYIKPNLKTLTRMPNFLNQCTQEALSRLGTYRFDDPSAEVYALPRSGVVEIEPNVYYEGQWKNGMRWGQVKQVWSDGSLQEIWQMAKEDQFMPTEMYTLESGSMIKPMEREPIYTAMEPLISQNGSRINNMVMGSKNGLMELSMKGIMIWVQNMELEFTNGPQKRIYRRLEGQQNGR